MPATRGRVVQTRRDEKPYKVILEHEDGEDTEHPVSSMQEGEALIRAHTPKPLRRDKSRDDPGNKD
jgi:hypothetical protein